MQVQIYKKKPFKTIFATSFYLWAFFGIFASNDKE